MGFMGALRWHLTRPFSGRVPRPPLTITIVQVPPLCPRPLRAGVSFLVSNERKTMSLQSRYIITCVLVSIMILSGLACTMNARPVAYVKSAKVYFFPLVDKPGVINQPYILSMINETIVGVLRESGYNVIVSDKDTNIPPSTWAIEGSVSNSPDIYYDQTAPFAQRLAFTAVIKYDGSIIRADEYYKSSEDNPSIKSHTRPQNWLMRFLGQQLANHLSLEMQSRATGEKGYGF
jgi:hypothetical protein